jgi:hypothetical protein
VLFLWTTNQHLRIAISVMEAWGFAYKSNYCWGKDPISLGRWQRGKHELLLIGTRGSPPCPAPGTQWESLILAPKSAHSAKPECFLEMIEQYFPTLPKIELNRRGLARPGWIAWGLEAEQTTERAAASPSEGCGASNEALSAEPDVEASSPCIATDPPNNDGLDIPNFLRIGHPDCTWRGKEAAPW